MPRNKGRLSLYELFWYDPFCFVPRVPPITFNPPKYSPVTQDALLVAQAEGDPTWDMDSAFQGKGITGFADRAESAKNEKKVNPDQSKYCQALPLKSFMGSFVFGNAFGNCPMFFC